MRTETILFFLSVLLTLPSLALAGAVSERDFSAETTENLINLCTATSDDPILFTLETQAMDKKYHFGGILFRGQTLSCYSWEILSGN